MANQDREGLQIDPAIAVDVPGMTISQIESPRQDLVAPPCRHMQLPRQAVGRFAIMQVQSAAGLPRGGESGASERRIGMGLSGKSLRRDRQNASRDRFFGVLLVLGILSSTASAKYGGGTGTAEDPYLIYTAEEFKAIGESPGDWDKDFRLMEDIDLGDYDESNLQMIGDWVALGSLENRPFNGVFDGNGKTIANFHYKNTQADYVGLFQHVVREIRDLHLKNATVVGNQLGVGALVGYLERGGVTRCTATGVDVSGNGRVGGLVGLVDGRVAQCGSDGRVAGVQYVGGLVGRIGEGSVAFSYSKANVTGGQLAGGLVGSMVRDVTTLDSCYALGDVSGTYYVGGLVGEVSQGRVYKCYAAGAVSGSDQVGGLIGNTRGNENLTQILASLWDVETSNQMQSAGGMGYTTTEMKSFEPYDSASWDFWGTWALCEGINYPILMWQIPMGDLVCPDGVTFIDFVWFAQNWRRSDCVALTWNCEGADFDDSGAVDHLDLATFAANWLAGID